MSLVEFRKCFKKFKILIARFQHLSGQKLVSVVEITTFEGILVSKEMLKVRKRAKIRNPYNQAPHLTQDTNRKVTTSQLDITNESQEASPFPPGSILSQYCI